MVIGIECKKYHQFTLELPKSRSSDVRHKTSSVVQIRLAAKKNAGKKLTVGRWVRNCRLISLPGETVLHKFPFQRGICKCSDSIGTPGIRVEKAFLNDGPGRVSV